MMSRPASCNYQNASAVTSSRLAGLGRQGTACHNLMTLTTVPPSLKRPTFSGALMDYFFSVPGVDSSCPRLLLTAQLPLWSSQWGPSTGGLLNPNWGVPHLSALGRGKRTAEPRPLDPASSTSEKLAEAKLSKGD